MTQTLKVRNTEKGFVYFLAENGKIVTDIRFIEYIAFEGLYTVTKKEDGYYTFLPKADGTKAYLPLSSILQQGYSVSLIN